jgi:hypothetical protein
LRTNPDGPLRSLGLQSLVWIAHMGILRSRGNLVCHFFSFEFRRSGPSPFRDLVDSQNKLTFGRRVWATGTMIPLSAAEAREGETILRHGF